MLTKFLTGIFHPSEDLQAIACIQAILVNQVHHFKRFIGTFCFCHIDWAYLLSSDSLIWHTFIASCNDINFITNLCLGSNAFNDKWNGSSKNKKTTNFLHSLPSTLANHCVVLPKRQFLCFHVAHSSSCVLWIQGKTKRLQTKNEKENNLWTRLP